MLYPKSPVYKRLMDAVGKLPVIDCHEHMAGPEQREKKDPLNAIFMGYIMNDLESSSFGLSAKEMALLKDSKSSIDDRWKVYEKLWKSTEHTAYARATKLDLKNGYGIQGPLDRAALDQVADILAKRTDQDYFRIIDEANIQAMLVDVLGWLDGGLGAYLSGKKTFPPKWRLMISLPSFHPTHFGSDLIQRTGDLADRHITSLDEFLEAVFTVFQRCIEKGVVGIKDQSAYERVIAYDLPTKADAERQFNQLLIDPRNVLGWPESKPLNDFLFHQYMRFARELKLPVQIHTGHMAGIYNQALKTNAAHLTPMLELHKEVHFDLFHGNWPYMGDLLYLGKNYPNVSLDLCWLHVIDPAYAIELMERAVQTIPHTKIHGFGGDYGDESSWVAAHLAMARQNITAALANLVEGSWLEEEQAIDLAKAWLFNNPNQFFKLGFAEI